MGPCVRILGIEVMQLHEYMIRRSGNHFHVAAIVSWVRMYEIVIYALQNKLYVSGPFQAPRDQLLAAVRPSISIRVFLSLLPDRGIGRIILPFANNQRDLQTGAQQYPGLIGLMTGKCPEGGHRLALHEQDERDEACTTLASGVPMLRKEMPNCGKVLVNLVECPNCVRLVQHEYVAVILNPRVILDHCAFGHERSRVRGSLTDLPISGFFFTSVPVSPKVLLRRVRLQHAVCLGVNNIAAHEQNEPRSTSHNPHYLDGQTRKVQPDSKTRP